MRTRRQSAGDLIPETGNWYPDADFGGRLVHVLEFDRAPGASDSTTTAQSIALMHHLTNRDTGSPQVRAAVLDAMRGTPDRPTARQIADAVFDFCKRTVNYQHEDTMQTPFSDFAAFLYDQTLIAPAALLQMPRPAGDCVDFSTLCAAMLQACHLTCAFKTIAADPDLTDYSHVYVLCQLAPGSFYALDTSNGPAPGIEFALPAGRKSRIWPNPANLQRRKTMIHDIRRRPARLGDTVTGDGDTDYSLDDYSTTGGAGYLMTGPNPTPAQLNYPVSQLPAAAGSSGGSAWTKIATTIINDAAAIATPLIRQSNIQAPYYIAGANGAQILYDPSTGKTANAGAASQRTPAVISQNLLIGAGVAAALVFALSMGGHKK